jgi:hypothetical protein
MKLTILLMVAAAWARGAEISVPRQPADYVLDETGTVTATERKAVQAEMERAGAELGLGVYLVLLTSGPDEPAADFARRLAKGWKGNGDRVVLVSGPELSPPLEVAAAGETLGKLRPEQLTPMAEAALAAFGTAKRGFPGLREAARSVISHMRNYRQNGVFGPAGVAAAPAAAANENNYLVAWIAGGSLLCCLVALFLMRRGRRTALIFPKSDFRQRFSAPHSGGNDALVRFGKGDGK